MHEQPHAVQRAAGAASPGRREAGRDVDHRASCRRGARGDVALSPRRRAGGAVALGGHAGRRVGPRPRPAGPVTAARHPILPGHLLPPAVARLQRFGGLAHGARSRRPARRGRAVAACPAAALVERGSRAVAAARRPVCGALLRARHPAARRGRESRSMAVVGGFAGGGQHGAGAAGRRPRPRPRGVCACAVDAACGVRVGCPHRGRGVIAVAPVRRVARVVHVHVAARPGRRHRTGAAPLGTRRHRDGCGDRGGTRHVGGGRGRPSPARPARRAEPRHRRGRGRCGAAGARRAGGAARVAATLGGGAVRAVAALAARGAGLPDGARAVVRRREPHRRDPARDAGPADSSTRRVGTVPRDRARGPGRATRARSGRALRAGRTAAVGRHAHGRGRAAVALYGAGPRRALPARRAGPRAALLDFSGTGRAGDGRDGAGRVVDARRVVRARGAARGPAGRGPARARHGGAGGPVGAAGARGAPRRGRSAAVGGDRVVQSHAVGAVAPGVAADPERIALELPVPSHRHPERLLRATGAAVRGVELRPSRR